jgi:hypothetical protein
VHRTARDLDGQEVVGWLGGCQRSQELATAGTDLDFERLRVGEQRRGVEPRKTNR